MDDGWKCECEIEARASKGRAMEICSRTIAGLLRKRSGPQGDDADEWNQELAATGCGWPLPTVGHSKPSAHRPMVLASGSAQKLSIQVDRDQKQIRGNLFRSRHPTDRKLRPQDGRRQIAGGRRRAKVDGTLMVAERLLVQAFPHPFPGGWPRGREGGSGLSGGAGRTWSRRLVKARARQLSINYVANGWGPPPRAAARHH